MKRLSLSIDGTSLIVPRTESRRRIAAIAVPNSGAASLSIELTDGAGNLAVRLTAANALGVCLAVGVIGDGAGSLIPNCPPDFWLEPTDTLTITASASIQSPVILSYEEAEEE